MGTDRVETVLKTCRSLRLQPRKRVTTKKERTHEEMVSATNCGGGAH